MESITFAENNSVLFDHGVYFSATQSYVADDSGVGGQSATTKTSAGRKIVGHGRPSLPLGRVDQGCGARTVPFFSAGWDCPRGCGPDKSRQGENLHDF